MNRIWLFALSTLTSVTLFAESPALPRVFVEPQSGFESYIAAGIIKKQVPVVITQNKDEANYTITSAVLEKEETTGGKIARCLFAYCAGIQGNQTATVQLVDAKSKEVLWAYNVKKQGASNYQSSAEAIAKHLKNWLAEKHK
jgi:hypothetical protein